MGLRNAVVDTVFAGQKDPLANIIIRDESTAVGPNGVVTAPEGTFCVQRYNGDAADDDVYINTDGSTTWVKIYDASVRGHV
ncbi:hypothetical protein LCGC14_0712600 [marine sediment metagenome]|uniref:Uncharacterized protein n=1 Tax=marine sediment metagenome TaxID=412755 RepID=A0A0F9QJ33_9ZZZZ